MIATPLILPSATGVVGVVRFDHSAISVQCQECGLIRSALRSVRYPILMVAGIHHHSDPWTSGHTDDPRLCRDCRLARGCTCTRCDSERRDSPRPWTNLPFRWEGLGPEAPVEEAS